MISTLNYYFKKSNILVVPRILAVFSQSPRGTRESQSQPVAYIIRKKMAINRVFKVVFSKQFFIPISAGVYIWLLTSSTPNSTVLSPSYSNKHGQNSYKIRKKVHTLLKRCKKIFFCLQFKNDLRYRKFLTVLSLSVFKLILVKIWKNWSTNKVALLNKLISIS